jgi:thiosulfate/3-mercaptopyruvate sulfurtransferase
MSDPLISTAELAAILGQPDVKLVDASWFLDGSDAKAGWREAHVPGAVFFDIDAISDHSNPLPHMLPTPEAFAEAVGKLGLGDQDHIVVYDQQGLFSAARVWWSLRAMGAERVQVLDGGLPKWRSEGRKVESGSVAIAPARFTAKFNPDLVRDVDQMKANVEARTFQVADARPAGRFTAEVAEPRAGLRSGHMPGARSTPFGSLLEANGTMKSADSLRVAFADAGVDVAGQIATTCGSGITASVVALALARLGRFDVPVYDGSWSEWGSREDTPIVTGPA